ncbi:hypothetical protein ILYODFUR_011879 [Ilyodon furcidens]|uniref:Secreted protein n=1 Tax=Ilyodon furcidens TaxID=33524 RepID=A0ABV0T7M0_9TELE
MLGFMRLRLEFMLRLGLFHPGTALVGGLVWTRWTPLLYMARSPDRDGGFGVGAGGQGLDWGSSGNAGTRLGWCCSGLPVSTLEGRGPPPGSGGWLPFSGIGSWTWEY